MWGFKRANHKQSGVALIVVLMLVSLMGLLMLQLSLTAKANTGRAQALLDRAQAQLEAQSVAAELQFALLTRNWVTGRSDVEPVETAGVLSAVTSSWNFAGERFNAGPGQARIQDVSGLLPMPLPGQSMASLVSAMTAVGIDSARAEALARILEQRFRDGDLLPMQNFFELGVIGRLTTEEAARVAAVMTLTPVQTFNPLTAPEAALRARYSGSVLQGLMSLRERGELDTDSYARLLGIGGDEFISLFPGPMFQLEVAVDKREARGAWSSVMQVEPYAQQPLTPWSLRRGLIGASP